MHITAKKLSLVFSALLMVGLCDLDSQRVAAQNTSSSDPVKLGYICQGDPQPDGYSIVRVASAPSIECGPLKAALFIEKTKSGLVVCGSSAVLAGYVIHTLDYIVSGVAPAPCPGIPGQEGWRIEQLGKVNQVCRLSNVIGTQYVVPPGYVVTGINSSPTSSCPGPIVTIKSPDEVETICDPFNINVILNAPFSIPLGYAATMSILSPPCPQSAGVNIERLSKTAKLFNGTSYQLFASSCSIESSIRSTSFDTPTQVEFINNSPEAVRIYWINYNGVRVLYNSLQPGQSYVQLTFVTHPWVVTDTNDSCRGIYFPAPEPGRVVLF